VLICLDLTDARVELYSLSVERMMRMKETMLVSQLEDYYYFLCYAIALLEDHFVIQAMRIIP